jgi:hypothetical protein
MFVLPEVTKKQVHQQVECLTGQLSMLNGPHCHFGSSCCG